MKSEDLIKYLNIALEYITKWRLNRLLWMLPLLGMIATSPARAANIAYVTGTGTSGDSVLIAHLETSGHTVSQQPSSNTWVPGDYDVILIDQNINSSSVEWVRDSAVGIVTMEGSNHDELNLGSNGNSDGHGSMSSAVVVSTAHYITETLSGSEIVSGFVSGEMGSMVNFVGEVLFGVGSFTMIGAAETGTVKHGTHALPTLQGRRAIMLFETTSEVTPLGLTLITRACEWASGLFEDVLIIPSISESIDENDTTLKSGNALFGVAGSPLITALANGTVGASVQGTYGSFSIESDGDWSYQLDREFDELEVSPAVPYTDSFSFTVAEGSDDVIVDAVFTVQGANDLPVFSGTPIGVLSYAIGDPINYVFPLNHFTDPENDAANLNWNLSALPNWLNFDQQTRTLSNIGSTVEGDYQITITATDQDSETSTDFDLFTLKVVSNLPATQPLTLSNAVALSGSKIDLEGEDLKIENLEAADIRVIAGSHESMRINPMGTVTINSTIGGANVLDANGTIRAKKVIVDTNWADYVFEDGYELRSLDEVARHIEEKGHLPGVPSAEEVESKGISLGDSQRILLEKIEELTLYIIKLEKRIEEMENDAR